MATDQITGEEKQEDGKAYSPSKLTGFSSSKGVYQTGARNNCRGVISPMFSGSAVNRNRFANQPGSLVDANSFAAHSRICLTRLLSLVVAKATVILSMPKSVLKARLLRNTM